MSNLNNLDEENEKALAKATTQMVRDLQNKMDEFNLWQCLECEGQPQFTHHEMMAHLREAHKIDPSVAKGTRRMLQHLDARDWYQSNYEFEIDGKKFINLIRNKRNRRTRMY